jgi:fructose/tagatose bisphosphate aldolase
MPLVNGKILLDRIREKRVLAGAFNTTNLETTISILNAIERSGVANFIQIAPTNAQLSGYDYIMKSLNVMLIKWMYRLACTSIMVKLLMMSNRPYGRVLPPL